MEFADLFLYFTNPVVDVTTDYRLYSELDFVANIGGSMGLLMGMSLLSVVMILMKLGSYLVKLMTTK